MRKYIVTSIAAILLLSTTIACLRDKDMDVEGTEYINLRMVGSLPDTIYLDTAGVAQLSIHLRCSIEHSNLWNNPQFLIAEKTDTSYNYAAIAHLQFYGDDGNGLYLTDDTTVTITFEATAMQLTDTFFSQRLYIDLVSPGNGANYSVAVCNGAMVQR